MATETKFTEEEIKSLSELSQKYQTTQSAFGQIRVQRILLNQQEKKETSQGLLRYIYLMRINQYLKLIQLMLELEIFIIM